MAANFDLGTAWVQLAVNSKGAVRQVAHDLGAVDLSKAENRITDRISGAFKNAAKLGGLALGALSAVGLATGFADIATQALAASDATDKFQSTLKFAGKADDEIRALTAATKKYADATVYELSDIQSITAQLAANGVKDYDRLAEAAGNLNAVAGGTVETYASVGMVLTQTAGQGRLTTENWNQLADAIPGASGRLQQALLDAGAYVGDFREAMANGEITAEEFNEAVLNLGFEEAAVEAATSTATMEGAWGNLEATLVTGATGLVDKVKPAVTGLLSDVSDGAAAAFEWVDASLLPSLSSLWTLLSDGTYDGSLFGLEEDDSLVQFLTNVRDIGADIWKVLRDDVIPGVEDFLDAVTSWGGWDQIAGFFAAIGENKVVLTDIVVALGAWMALDLAGTLIVWGVQITLNTAKIVLNTAAWIANAWAQGVSLAETALLVAMYTGDFLRAAASQAFAVGRSTLAWAANTFALGASKAAMVLSTAAQWALNAALSANPIGLVIIGLVALGAALLVAWNKSETFRSIVTKAWEGIKHAASAVTSWFRDTAWPTIQGVWDGITSGVTSMKDSVEKAWNGIKAAAAKPVNFLISTVYTDGIKKLSDKVLSALGLELRLPSISPIGGYATGGVLPGYTPGRDVHRFWSPTGGVLELSGGEAIMRPEWTRAVGGPAAVAAMNMAARTGRALPLGDVGRAAAFKDGGVWDWVTGAASTVGDWIETAADAAASIISDPLGAVANLIRTPVDAILAGLPGTGFIADTARTLPGQLIDSFGQWLEGETASMSSSALVDQARRAIGTPYVWGGVDVPGGVDCSGLVVWALRQMGVGVPRHTASSFQAASTPSSPDVPGNLLFWGGTVGRGGAWHVAVSSGNGMMVEAPNAGSYVGEVPIWGNPSAGAFKYDRGGWLQPGLTTVLNATGRPEPVLTNSQWDKLNEARSLPDSVALRVDGTEFRAYVEQVSAAEAERVVAPLSSSSVRDALGVH